jgi:hypothetical protein
MSGTKPEFRQVSRREGGPVTSVDMLVVTNLEQRSLDLQEPDDFGSFSVRVEGAGGPDVLEAVVTESGLGRMQPDGSHVVVHPVALRALAGVAATAAWDEGFEAMCAYAAGKGWVEADGGILAHVEWPGESD